MHKSAQHSTHRTVSLTTPSLSLPHPLPLCSGIALKYRFSLDFTHERVLPMHPLM
jgi:hypothetical protein